jgi:NAD(P)-dependent dehydrogenase (short-subunit alcohol dehydrogenase family)
MVTGGTSGLGLAIAENFLAQGFDVYVLGRKARLARQALRGSRFTFVRHDLRDLSAIGKVIALVKRARIDCFVSNAGVYSDRGVGLSDAGARTLLTTNLFAPILILKNVYKHFKARQSGTIVCINSIAGLDPNFNEAVYVASKHGMRGFARSLAIDASRNNVRVLDYYLGAMRTRMTRGRPGWDSLMDPAEIGARIVSDVANAHSFVPSSQELRRAPAMAPA